MKTQNINLFETKINAQAVHILPEDIVRQYKCFPFALDKKTLKIAMTQPDDIIAIDEMELISGYKVKPYYADEDQIMVTIEKYFKIEESTKQTLVDMRMEALKKAKSQEDESKVAELRQSDSQPIVNLLNSIINHAIANKASDIHIEPSDPEMRIRYRVDGVLHDVMSIPKSAELPIISRAKILSNMDITEKRRPQDGHLSIKYLGKTYDLRLSCLPTILGEKIVIRILDKSQLLINLKKLGFSEQNENAIKSLIKKPYGMIFVTGPTGSGKTTLLYSVLNHLNNPKENIITVEDPVEYQLKGVNQINVNPQSGLTFASGLRSILRQDPNIIMVGEVRDLETAEIAVQSALTGHLVLSTLHTNDAPSAVTRLVDMGIEPFLIASTVIGVVGQRLARTICIKCNGKGCDFCYQTGMKGRTGIYEIMQMTDEIRKLILERASATEIKKLAIKQGMHTLQMCGQEKIKAGICTKEEIEKVVYTD
jgi:type IV pilus assembly protein PilB